MASEAVKKAVVLVVIVERDAQHVHRTVFDVFSLAGGRWKASINSLERREKKKKKKKKRVAGGLILYHNHSRWFARFVSGEVQEPKAGVSADCDFASFEPSTKGVGSRD